MNEPFENYTDKVAMAFNEAQNYKSITVIWETDGEVVDLPSVVDIPIELNDEDEIANWLSDKYGWLVDSWF